VVVRSDVDLTYLDTHFMSTTDKLALLIQRGSERSTLPRCRPSIAACAGARRPAEEIR
jgi:hypothetical protein